MEFEINNVVIEHKDIQDPFFGEVFRACAANCMSLRFKWIEPLYSLYLNVKYLVENQIPGDIVECGVWRGGMMQLIALTLKHLGDESRQLYLYDTYEGMPEPGEHDRDWDGLVAKDTWDQYERAGKKWGYGGNLEYVQQILKSTGYPEDKLVWVKGMVEDTIPGVSPDSISLLRLDTDFYSSTRHELVELFPKLSVGGVLVIDDYGYFQGARKATDEYLRENNVKMLLHRVHTSVYQGVKLA